MAEPHATPRPGTGRLIGLIVVVIVALTIPFGWSVMRNHETFAAYQDKTIDSETAPPPWEGEAAPRHSVEDCVTYTVNWAMECPGIQSWCQAEVPVVVDRCLASQDRQPFCDGLEGEWMSTRFGFHECNDLRESVEGKYAKRAHKKYCALSYRGVADHCKRLGE